jgi:tetratricopeptide (TPR) repeat protein
MTTSPTPEYEKSETGPPGAEETEDRIRYAGELSSDPDYIKLLEHYQQAEFDACKNILDQLEDRYPNHPQLKNFREELQMKLGVSAMRASMRAGEKRVKRTATLKLSVFAIVGTLIVLIAFFFTLIFFIRDVEMPELAPPPQDTTQLNSFYQQADQLLLGGQPQPAVEIIEKIREIDPNFAGLSDLTARADELLQWEVQYQAGLNLVSEGKFDEAREIFVAIEEERPGLWDVNKQITAIDNAQQIAQYLQEGEAAFQAKRWQAAITAYENVLSLDPRVDNTLMKEQLVNSYLNQIINLLEQENATVQEIESAEGYYRKALALIPQDKAFITERGNLQEVSQDLLVLKLTQFARDYLQSSDQTQTTVIRAVSLLRKASEIKPTDSQLSQELRLAETYQTGFGHFVSKEWLETIESLDPLVADNPNFAGGNALILLYEAYYALAKRYYATSIYPDALGYLEEAEFLVWGNDQRLLNLFQTQVLMGDILGQTGDYENAVSYYQYALNAIQTQLRVQNLPSLSINLTAAENAVANEAYEDAFRTFKNVLDGIDAIFISSEFEIRNGATLALFANHNGSTMDLVIEANQLPNEMVINRGQTLLVPTIAD